MDLRQTMQVQKSLHIKIFALKSKINELEQKNEMLFEDKKKAYDQLYDEQQKNKKLRKEAETLNEQIKMLEHKIQKTGKVQVEETTQNSQDLVLKINSKIARELEHFAEKIFDNETKLTTMEVEKMNLAKELEELRKEKKHEISRMEKELRKRNDRDLTQENQQSHKIRKIGEKNVREQNQETKKILMKMEKKLESFKQKVEESRNFDDLYNFSIKRITRLKNYLEHLKQKIWGKTGNKLSLSRNEARITKRECRVQRGRAQFSVGE